MLFTAMIACSAFPLRAQSLQGSWTVNQITVVKTIDGKADTTVYSGNETGNYSSCPQEWAVKDAKTLTLRYANGNEKTVEYKVNGNKLTFAMLGVLFTYEYSLNGENLVLTTTRKHAEELLINLTKQ